MTVAQSKSTSAADKLLLWAVVVSIAIHLMAYGGWKWGHTQPWWKKLSLPAWLQLVPKNLKAAVAKGIPPAPPPPIDPLLYVAVDPAQAAVEPPKNPKYYSSATTAAANPEKKIASDIPNITGSQDKVPKTIASGDQLHPLQPSPPLQPKMEVADAKPPPKQSFTPGDLTMAKPAEKTNDTKGTSEADLAAAAHPDPQPDTPHVRPRTLAQVAEALSRQGLPGAKSRQEGGVPRLASDSSFDAIRTPYGDYDRDFIDAIRAKWFSILENRNENVPGKVVVEFNLHSDGSITDVKIIENQVNDLLAEYCREAIVDPAPYKKWPQEMRNLIGDPRQLRFTFYYDNGN